MPAVRALTGALLVVLATARLTRLFTEDSLGRWYFHGPIEAWGDRHEKVLLDRAIRTLRHDSRDHPVLARKVEQYDESDPWSWQKRLASGAGCRWCVGFWIGGLVLTSDVLTRTPWFGWARPVFRFGLAVLALNTVSNWVGEKTGTLS